jgi:hypothetical protein
VLTFGALITVVVFAMMLAKARSLMLMAAAE